MRLIDADAVMDKLNVFNDHDNGNEHFVNGIETAKEIVDETPTVGEWVSVKDRLPENETDVLAYLNDGEETRMAPCVFFNGVWFDCVMNCTVVFQNVTHWMPLPPLPPPPKEGT